MLRFVVAILDHSEADEIIRAQAFLVVQHRHGVGAHDRAAGRARERLFDRRSSRNVLRWAAILRSYPLRRQEKRKREGCIRKEGISLVCYLVLETVGAVKRDAVLLIVAKRLVGLFLDILVAETKSDMGC